MCRLTERMLLLSILGRHKQKKILVCVDKALNYSRTSELTEKYQVILDLIVTGEKAKNDPRKCFRRKGSHTSAQVTCSEINPVSTWTSVLTGRLSVSLSPVSVRHRPVDHLRGPGGDADGSAGPALPGALHSAHQPRCSSVAQGVAPVLDWKWICGEYQFDMTAYRLPKNRKDFKKKKKKNNKKRKQKNI